MRGKKSAFQVFFKKRCLAQAKKEIEESLKINPDDGSANAEAAQIYLALEEKDQAKQAIENALRIDSENVFRQ